MAGKIATKISDMVDTEWFLALDTELGEKTLSDPELVKGILPEMPDAACLSHWLAFQRKRATAEGQRPLVGEQVVFALKLGVFLLVFLGFICGFSVALGLLTYDGKTPVNLLYALLLLVGLPLISVFLSLLILFFRKKSLPLSYRLFLSLIIAFLFRFLKSAGRKIPLKVQNLLAVRGRQMERFSAQYGHLVRAFAFFAFQAAGFALVLGMMCAFVLKVIGTDLAFAWQSTLMPGTELVETLTRTLSAPWRFFLPQAFPDPAQIEGSRVILKEGIGGLDARHLTAWWSFLLMSLLLYGVFPRALLALFALWRLGERVREAEIQDSRVQRLGFVLRRAALRGEEKNRTPSPEPPRPVQKTPLEGPFLEKTEKPAPGPQAWELWIINEIPESLHQRIAEKTAALMGTEPCGVFTVDMDALSSMNMEAPLTRVLALEVFMPPVREDLQMLREAAVKNKAPFWIFPVGRPRIFPGEEARMEGPDPEDVAIWSKRLEGLQEPRPLLHGEVNHGR